MSELKLRPTKASAVVDFRDEPEGISFDVQHGKSAHGIRRREHLPDFHQAAPSRFLGDAIPNVQRAGEFRVHAYGLQKLLAADDVQERSRKPLNSQFANFSRGSSRFAIRAEHTCLHERSVNGRRAPKTEGTQRYEKGKGTMYRAPTWAWAGCREKRIQENGVPRRPSEGTGALWRGLPMQSMNRIYTKV